MLIHCLFHSINLLIDCYTTTLLVYFVLTIQTIYVLTVHCLWTVC